MILGPMERPPRKPMSIEGQPSERIDNAPSRLQRCMDAMATIQLPPTPPGVPKRSKAQDDAFQMSLPFIQGAGGAGCSGCAVGFLGFPILAELSQISEYRQPSQRLAQEMTRKWIRFRSSGEEDKTQVIHEIERWFQNKAVQQRIYECVEYDGLFGRAQLYIDLGVSKQEMAKPLTFDNVKIKKGSVKRLTVIDPTFSYPLSYNASNPLDDSFYQPQSWYVMSQEVHDTRLLTFISREVPDLLKPVYAFSGMSLSQLAIPTVENFLRMRQSVSDIVLNYSMRGIKTNLESILQGSVGAVDDLIERVKLYAQQAKNDGMMVLDKELEDFFQYTTPLSNLDKLLEQARDNMCSVSNTPKTILFGLSPQGMNASSEGELKIFEQYIAGAQEALLRHPLTRILEVAQLDLYGAIDTSISFDFVPLREMDEKELAQIRSQEAQADNIYVALGAVASDEVRAKIANDPASGWSNLDLSRKIEPVSRPEPNTTGSQPNTTQLKKPA